MSAPFVLVVDDEPDIRELVKEILVDEGYQVATAEDGSQARKALRDRRPDLILLDIWMPELDGISLLKEWKAAGELPCPVIMMSGHGTVETAVEATRLGAYDFLEKPLSLAKLLLTVERALEAHRLAQENRGLRRGNEHMVEPVGTSQVMTRLREQVKRVAQHDSWVLITGEPGSGRETIARYLHAHSARRDGPFVDVGVTGITQGGAALELFGREDGERIQYGRLEQASGGILFLDEVADMDLEVQAQLVSALDTGTFLRVGGTQAVQLDARVVAATRHDLQQRVNSGAFREDLFFQLNVVPLRVPPLRERPEDIPLLLSSAVDRLVVRERLPYRHFSVAAQNYLRNYAWPGNVRELINLVQRVLILGGDTEISVDEVRSALGEAQSDSEAPQFSGVLLDQPLREAREAFEKAYLEYHYAQSGGNISRMAQAVGMERTHLYRKLKDRGIAIKGR